MTICLVDTSIFLNILDIPGRADQRTEVMAELIWLVRKRTELLLPLAAILETGNHIAHLDDGRMRRLCAERFVAQVRKALAGEAPWTVTPMPHPDEVQGWLDRFPDAAMQELGLADLAIVAEWEVQCRRWPARRVFIWSLDEHLNSHNREP